MSDLEPENTIPTPDPKPAEPPYKSPAIRESHWKMEHRNGQTFVSGEVTEDDAVRFSISLRADTDAARSLFAEIPNHWTQIEPLVRHAMEMNRTHKPCDFADDMAPDLPPDAPTEPSATDPFDAPKSGDEN